MKKLLCFLFIIPLIALANGEIISPNMSMPIPAVGITKGPIYATDINNSLLIVDKHDHTPGNGVPITPAGLNINSDLSLVNNNLTNARTTRFSSRLVPITSVSPDIAELYSVLGELYYNDSAGHQVPITNNGSVNAGSGSITGLPSGTAGAAYQSSSGTFQFTQATSTAANIDVATLILRYPGSYPTPSGNYIALEAPSSLATGYALTYPSTLPSTTGSWLSSDTSGVQSWTAADNTTIQNVTGVVAVKSQGITATQIANNTITTSQISNSAGITNVQLATANFVRSSNVVSFTTSSTTAVTIASVTITTSGNRTILLSLQPKLGFPAATGSLSVSDSSVAPVATVTFIDSGGATYARELIGGFASGGLFPYPPSAFNCYINGNAAGTYTFSVQANVAAGTSTFSASNVNFIATEL